MRPTGEAEGSVSCNGHDFFERPSSSCLIWSEARPTCCILRPVVWIGCGLGHFQHTGSTGCSLDSASSKARVRRTKQPLQGSTPPREAGFKSMDDVPVHTSPAETCCRRPDPQKGPADIGIRLRIWGRLQPRVFRLGGMVKTGWRTDARESRFEE